MQQDASETIHRCYITAFKAINSEKAETWTLDDTKKMLSISPEKIWKDKSLWGEAGETARTAFYYKFHAQPRMDLKPAAYDMLKRLEEQGHEFYIFSMKSKQLLLREISYTRSACMARGIYGTLPCVELTKENLLGKIVFSVKGRKPIVIVSHDGYKQSAETCGCEFLEASDEAFNNICPVRE